MTQCIKLTMSQLTTAKRNTTLEGKGNYCTLIRSVRLLLLSA